MRLYFFLKEKNKMVQAKNEILDEIADNTSSKIKEFYSPKYYYQKVSQ